MGMLGKIKKFFEDEVEEEIVIDEEEEAKQKREKPRKENPVQANIRRTDKYVEPIKSEIEEVIPRPSFKKPVIFDDRDFVSDEVKVEVPKVKPVVKPVPKPKPHLYQQSKPQDEKKEEKPKEKKPIFKPTPVISPVYGVLDKDYRKEDIVTKKETPNTIHRAVDVDMIRNKAYGTLEDELESTIFGSFDDLNVREETISSVEIMPTRTDKNRDLLVEFELEELRPARSKTPIKEDLEATSIIPMIEDPVVVEKPVVKKEPVKETAADDLFELIDSMYEEKE